MEIVPNYDQVEEQKEFAPIETGTYTARIYEVKPGQDKEGANALDVTYEIYGERYANRRVWQNNVSVTGPNAWRFQKWAKGVLGEVPPAGEPVNVEMFIGREVLVTIEKAMSSDGTKAYANVKAVSAQ